jgi:hypothetical protein
LDRTNIEARHFPADGKASPGEDVQMTTALWIFGIWVVIVVIGLIFLRGVKSNDN